MTIEPPKKVGNNREKENKKDMTTTKNKKKSKKSSFMMCFISPADDCLPEKPHHRVGGGSGNESTHKKVMKNIPHHHVESLDVAIDKFEIKKMNNGEMPRVLDAVLLANSLESMKNSMHNNKMRISSYRRMLPFEEETGRSSSCNLNTCLTSSCSGSCSSSTSSSASNSRSNSFDGREANNFFSQGINYHGLWLVLIILSVLMFCGKLCAILCTSTWLYFVSHRRRRHRSLGRVRATAVNHDQFVNLVDTVDYKRRVVLEGFLERNNRPREL